MPTVIANIHSELRQIVAAFLASPKKNPRVKLAYTYLIAWNVFHCPALMTFVPSHSTSRPFVQYLAESSWTNSSLSSTRDFLLAATYYQLYRSPPKFDGATDGMSFVDLARDDRFTMLAPGPYAWLINICPRYHMSWHGVHCQIESYQPSDFAHQFGYYQLYVGNTNSGLCARGSLPDGAWT